MKPLVMIIFLLTGFNGHLYAGYLSNPYVQRDFTRPLPGQVIPPSNAFMRTKYVCSNEPFYPTFGSDTLGTLNKYGLNNNQAAIQQQQGGISTGGGPANQSAGQSSGRVQ